MRPGGTHRTPEMACVFQKRLDHNGSLLDLVGALGMSYSGR